MYSRNSSIGWRSRRQICHMVLLKSLNFQKKKPLPRYHIPLHIPCPGATPHIMERIAEAGSEEAMNKVKYVVI